MLDHCMRLLSIPLLLSLSGCTDMQGSPTATGDFETLRVGNARPIFDPGGVPALRVTKVRGAPSSGTPGGTVHGTILNLVVDRAHDAPNVAVIGAARTAHRSGHMSGTVIGVEGFVYGGGGGTAKDLRAISGIVTMFDALRADSAAGLRTSVNANPEWTGALNNAYGLYVGDIEVGQHRWAVYTEGPSPSRFGGPVRAPAFVVESRGERRDLVALIDSLAARVAELERRLARLDAGN